MNPQVQAPPLNQAPSVQSASPQPADPSQRTKPMSVVALVLAFIVPPAGLVMSIVVLAKKWMGSNRVLGILGTVFGALNTFSLFILIGLVLSTTQGIQTRAKDAETKTTANSLQSQLELYWTENGSYPLTTQIYDTSWLVSNTTWDQAEALTVVSNDKITYYPEPADCKNTTASPCTSYVLRANLSTGEIYTPEKVSDSEYRSDPL